MKFISIIFLFLLFSHNVLYYLSQEILVLESKIGAKLFHEKKDRLPELSIIKVLPKAIASYDEDELTIEGKLYDVEKIIISGDSAYYYAIEDTGEENAVKRLSDHFTTENTVMNSSKTGSYICHSSFSGIDHLYTFPFFYLPGIYHSQLVQYPIYYESNSYNYRYIIKPPPKTALYL